MPRLLPKSALPGLALLALGVLLTGCADGLQPRDEARIAGSTYVVTGASSGFGQGVALKLGAHGANVVLAARRTDLLESVAAEVRELGGSALVVTTDVSRQEDVRRLARAAQARYGDIDVWINNAGVIAFGRFWDVPVEDHVRVVAVNLNGVIYGSHEALRRFRAQGYGTLVNVGSIESELPTANQASYSASKAAILSLGRALNAELRLSDLERIEVATVMPWAANTPIWTHAANYTGHEPRMIALDDPWQVVDAIIRASLDPREEVLVGWKSKGAYLSHQLFPDLSERIAANIVEEQFEEAPPAPPREGALYEPMLRGRTVEGDLIQRMEAAEP